MSAEAGDSGSAAMFEWQSVDDHALRKGLQNKLAQRRRRDRLKLKPSLSPTGCSEPAPLLRTDRHDPQLCQANGLDSHSAEGNSHAVALASLAELFRLDDFVELATPRCKNMLANRSSQPHETGIQAAFIDSQHQCPYSQTDCEDDELFSGAWDDVLLGGLSVASPEAAPSALQISPDSISPPGPVFLNRPGSTRDALPLPQSLDNTSQAWGASDATAISPVTVTSKATMDDKLAKVLEVMIGEGFTDFEDMAQAYYTGTVATRSDLAVRQSVSRKRNLPRLIEAIHHASGAWRSDEAKSWQDAIVRSAEAVYLSELNGVSQTVPTTYPHCHDALHVPLAVDSLDDRDRVPEQIPELWSLVSVLALHAASSEVKKKRIFETRPTRRYAWPVTGVVSNSSCTTFRPC